MEAIAILSYSVVYFFFLFCRRCRFIRLDCFLLSAQGGVEQTEKIKKGGKRHTKTALKLTAISSPAEKSAEFKQPPEQNNTVRKYGVKRVGTRRGCLFLLSFFSLSCSPTRFAVAVLHPPATCLICMCIMYMYGYRAFRIWNLDKHFLSLLRCRKEPRGGGGEVEEGRGRAGIKKRGGKGLEP